MTATICIGCKFIYGFRVVRSFYKMMLNEYEFVCLLKFLVCSIFGVIYFGVLWNLFFVLICVVWRMRARLKLAIFTRYFSFIKIFGFFRFKCSIGGDCECKYDILCVIVMVIVWFFVGFNMFFDFKIVCNDLRRINFV